MTNIGRQKFFEQKAIQILGLCTCSSDYTERKLIAPDCVWHNCHAELEELLEDVYQLGLMVGEVNSNTKESDDGQQAQQDSG